MMIHDSNFIFVDSHRKKTILMDAMNKKVLHNHLFHIEPMCQILLDLQRMQRNNDR